jgi:type I restriction enzyme, S subunit
MDVRPGYKHTEAGLIPEEWEVKPLRRISPRQSVGLVINPSTYFDKAGTVPLLVGSNVSENVIDASSANRITKASNEALAASRLSAGDLLTVRVGEPGTTAVVPPELDGCNCASMMIVRKDASFDSHWLCAAMNSRSGRRQIEGVQYGTAQKQFNISDAIDFIFAVPPLPEQRAIAGALNDADALLSGLGRLIAKKRDLKQAAMQQILTGQTRLPGFSGEWDAKRLGEIGEISGAGVDKKLRPDEVPVRLLNYMDVYRKDFLRSVDLSHEVSARQEQVRRCAVQRGDVFFTPTSEVPDDIGHSAVALDDISDAVYSYHLVRLRITEKWDVDFRGYAFKTKDFTDQASTQCEGSGTRYVITLPKFRSMTIRYPKDAKEQAAIAAVFSDIDAELSALEARRDKTRALKQAMMQELLTGRTRLV